MKKWIFIILAVLILGFVLFFYVSFNGNPISKKIAQNIMEDYIGEVFEGSTYTFEQTGYNFKDASYYFRYTIEDGEQKTIYNSEVKGAWIPSHVMYTSIEEESKDHIMTNEYHVQANKFIKELLVEKGVPVEEVSYDVLIAKGQYDLEDKWTPNMPAKTVPSIWIDVVDEGQTKEQFKEMVELIQQTLKEHDVTYVSVRAEITRQYDNTDGKKEGYAPIYYETLYTAKFTIADEKITVNE